MLILIFILVDRSYVTCVDQRQYQRKYQYIFPCTDDCSLHTLPYHNSALCSCCTHGKPALISSILPAEVDPRYSVWFMLSAMAGKNIGTRLMHALILSVQDQGRQPPKQQGASSPL